MSKRLKLKLGILIGIVAIGMIVMGVWVSTMQTNLSLENYTQEMQQESEALPDLLASAQDETEQNTKNFDAIYQSKAESVAFMANNNAGYKATNAKMKEYQSLLDVDNIMIVSSKGKILAKAEDTKADFTSSRFNRLHSVLEDGGYSDAVKVDSDEQNWHKRYYSAKIDDDTMVVVEQSPDELDQLIADSGSTEAVLKNITIGQTGYMFAISAQDYTIQYHPDSALVGADALDRGFDVADLEDGNYCWVNLDGESMYCNITRVDDMYYVAAVPESDISSARSITTGVILFVFLAVTAMVVLYGVCVLRDNERRRKSAGAVAGVSGGASAGAVAAGTATGSTPAGSAAAGGTPAGTQPAGEGAAGSSAAGEDADYIDAGANHRINKAIAKKGAVLSLVGFVAILGIAFYMQTLFALSSQSVMNNSRVDELAATIQQADDRADALRSQYSERYLNKAEVAAYVLEANPDLANKADLQKLADVLQVQYVDIFDEEGNMSVTNSTYSKYTLSDDPNDASYEFRRLLQGVDHVVQDARTDEISGELRQYIGVSLKDDEGNPNGFVQINVRPSRLADLLDSVQIDKVLDGVKVGADGFAFAINKNDGTFAYYPDSKMIGKTATDCGMTENQLKDGYNDYLTIGGETYYAASAEQGDYYLYVAGSEGELMAERGPLMLATAVVALICQLLIFVILAFERKRDPFAKDAASEDEAAIAADDRHFDVTLPTGRSVRTESIASRFFFGAFDWEGKTPEQKVGAVMKVLVGFSVLVVFIAVMFRESIFGSDSLFSYILGGEWERGLNIFAITASIMFACVAMTVATVLKKLLLLLAETLDSRGETVCRLLGSFVKYATIIGMIYYCLALLGVDTTTLLASAGILSIAISLGAKDLVADILSGLFLIFEGAFRVGDIITVGGWRGTVVEIGIRTTKIMNGAQNIKVIRNSNVSDIVNMTKQSTYTWLDVGIEYSESLERVEDILADELPRIKEQIPAIIGGPFYKGVVSLGDNSVNIRIMAQCAEADRAQVERDLNRAIKLLFDKHDIGIPYPQVVVNQPAEKKSATFAEKRDADRFYKEQREASKEIKEGEDQ